MFSLLEGLFVINAVVVDIFAILTLGRLGINMVLFAQTVVLALVEALAVEVDVTSFVSRPCLLSALHSLAVGPQNDRTSLLILEVRHREDAGGVEFCEGGL